MLPRQLACLLVLAVFPASPQLVSRSQAVDISFIEARNAAAASMRVIQVTARKYHFSPDPLRVRQGEHVLLVATALDHDHGFNISALGINDFLRKGRSLQIPLPTSRPGVYTIRCSHFCGIGHFWMKGKLINTPAEPASMIGADR